MEAADDVLKRTSDEEVLLNEAKLLPVFGRIIRIEHFRDGLTHRLFTNSFDVTTIVENIEVKLMRRLRVPEPEEVDRLAAIANDTNIVRYAFDRFVVDPLRFEEALAIHLMLDTAKELYFLRKVRAHNFPWTAFFHPHIGVFDLVTVFKFLTKEAILIMDTIADRGQIQRG